jgi:hypothetical protein
MIAFGEIFLKYFWNIFEIKNILNFYLKNYNILLKVMFKIWKKMLFSKKFKSIDKSFYYLKTSVTMLNECFC